MAEVAGRRLPARAAYLDLAEPDLEPSPASSRRPVTAGRWSCRCCSPPPSTPPSTCPRPYARPPSPPESNSWWPTSWAPATTSPTCSCPRLADAGVGPEASVLLSRSAPRTPAANAAVAELADGCQRRPGCPGPGGVRHLRPAPGRGAGPAAASRWPILPLFLADGLLLDPVRTLAAERGWTMVEPLGERAAGVVLDRYGPRSDAAATSDRFCPWPSPRRTPAGAIRRPSRTRSPRPRSPSSPRALGDDNPAYAGRGTRSPRRPSPR